MMMCDLDLLVRYAREKSIPRLRDKATTPAAISVPWRASRSIFARRAGNAPTGNPASGHTLESPASKARPRDNHPGRTAGQAGCPPCETSRTARPLSASPASQTGARWRQPSIRLGILLLQLNEQVILLISCRLRALLPATFRGLVAPVSYFTYRTIIMGLQIPEKVFTLSQHLEMTSMVKEMSPTGAQSRR